MTTVLLAHASVELYGSDLQLVETAAGCVDAGADVVVLLPGHGPLAERMRSVGARVETLDVPVLRKAHLTPRGVVGLGAGTLRALGPMTRLIRRLRPGSPASPPCVTFTRRRPTRGGWSAWGSWRPCCSRGTSW